MNRQELGRRKGSVGRPIRKAQARGFATPGGLKTPVARPGVLRRSPRTAAAAAAPSQSSSTTTADSYSQQQQQQQQRQQSRKRARQSSSIAMEEEEDQFLDEQPDYGDDDGDVEFENDDEQQDDDDDDDDDDNNNDKGRRSAAGPSNNSSRRRLSQAEYAVSLETMLLADQAVMRAPRPDDNKKLFAKVPALQSLREALQLVFNEVDEPVPLYREVITETFAYVADDLALMADNVVRHRLLKHRIRQATERLHETTHRLLQLKQELAQLKHQVGRLRKRQKLDQAQQADLEAVAAWFAHDGGPVAVDVQIGVGSSSNSRRRGGGVRGRSSSQPSASLCKKTEQLIVGAALLDDAEYQQLFDQDQANKAGIF